MAIFITLIFDDICTFILVLATRTVRCRLHVIGQATPRQRLYSATTLTTTAFGHHKNSTFEEIKSPVTSLLYIATRASVRPQSTDYSRKKQLSKHLTTSHLPRPQLPRGSEHHHHGRGIIRKDVPHHTRFPPHQALRRPCRRCSQLPLSPSRTYHTHSHDLRLREANPLTCSISSPACPRPCPSPTASQGPCPAKSAA